MEEKQIHGMCQDQCNSEAQPLGLDPEKKEIRNFINDFSETLKDQIDHYGHTTYGIVPESLITQAYNFTVVEFRKREILRSKLNNARYEKDAIDQSQTLIVEELTKTINKLQTELAE